MTGSIITIEDSQDFLVVDGPPPPPVILDATTGEDILLISSEGPPIPGPRGEPGPQGPQGPPGQSAMAFELEQQFASPATTWVIEHNFGTYGLVVETFDQNGDSIEGNVRFVSDNQVEVDFYYATAGVARIFR